MEETNGFLKHMNKKLGIKLEMKDEGSELRAYEIEKNIPQEVSKTIPKDYILKKYHMVEKLEIGDSFLISGNQVRIDSELAKIRKCLKLKNSKIVLIKRAKPRDVINKLLETKYSPDYVNDLAKFYARIWRIT